MTKRILLLLLAVAAKGQVAAEPASAPLTLDQAIEAALKGSQQLAAAEAGAEAADAAVRESASYRLPRLEISETFARTTNPVYVFMNKLGQEAFSAADFDPNLLNRPPAFDNFNTKVQLSQPLYAGGKIDAGAAAARYGSEAAHADRERTRQVVVHQVIEAYSGAVLAAAHLRVAEEALATSKAHVKLVRDMFDTGMVVESDLLEAKVHEAEIEEQVIEAHAGVEVARAGLNMAMGRSLDEPLVLPDAVEPPSAPAESLGSLTAEVQKNRRDLQAMADRVQAAQQMERVARSGFLPEVGVTGAYEMNKETAPGREGSNWSVFVGAKWAPFDGGGTSARLARARAERSAAERMSELLRKAADLEVRRAWYALAAARQRSELASSAVTQAGAALKIVEDRYKAGLATIVELMGAQTAVAAARTREISARRDVLLGQATLDLATGRL